MSQPQKPHVVIVDDEPHLCELLALRLKHHGYRVTTELTGHGGIAVLSRERVDAMIVDLRLEDGDGLDVLTEVQKRSPDVPVVILTAHGTIETAVEAMKRGAYGFLTKPFHDHDLLQKLAHAVESAMLRREVAGLRRIVGAASDETRLLGTSDRIAVVREIIARVGPSDATVLLLGESGTGKELAARSLHGLSPRRDQAFVAVNCSALPAELLESELFGYVRGAFTGALRDKEGLFAAAHRGTLFLDEIGDAPPAVQVKLLRVLQERRYNRVGSPAEEEVDVRVIAATNRDLRSEVQEGRFREDLFYRLHVVPIVMPPLRERVEDIPLLCDVFLARAAARHGLSEPQMSSDAMRVLLAHPWPGNVRELANVLEGAVLLCRGQRLQPEDLGALLVPPPRKLEARKVDAEPEEAEMTVTRDGAGDAMVVTFRDSAAELPPLKEAREAFERAYLVEVLRRANGNVTAAAKLSGRNRTDFYDLLRKHGLSSASFKE